MTTKRSPVAANRTPGGTTLSVAAPPVSEAHALHVAAEHFAFCPDNIDQGAGSLREYAEDLREATSWSFWWD